MMTGVAREKEDPAHSLARGGLSPRRNRHIDMPARAKRRALRCTHARVRLQALCKPCPAGTLDRLNNGNVCAQFAPLPEPELS
ncbi:hypothetical protein [Paraburkholderia sp. J7]|uniref:hypothetical protein n=1 Tax=Paraburkholderia sp. J7 TaxID=2805438 RepID=UPI002AB66850|nr:hypothetical protein [Paraburkholderia sp. J7]